jgi:hypothetical protein
MTDRRLNFAYLRYLEVRNQMSPTERQLFIEHHINPELIPDPSPPLCIEPGCNRPARYRSGMGLCARHYQAQRRQR